MEGDNLGMYPLRTGWGVLLMYPCWVAYHDTWFDCRALVLEALIPVTAVADTQPCVFSVGGGRGGGDYKRIGMISCWAFACHPAGLQKVLRLDASQHVARLAG